MTVFIITRERIVQFAIRTHGAVKFNVICSRFFRLRKVLIRSSDLAGIPDKVKVSSFQGRPQVSDSIGSFLKVLAFHVIKASVISRGRKTKKNLELPGKIETISDSNKITDISDRNVC